MSSFTDYTEQAIRDWMSQGTTMPAAMSTLYVGLHSSNPGESPDGSTEVSAADYSRHSFSDWAVLSNGFDNNTDIVFPTATNNWGTIKWVSLWDSSSSGNCLVKIQLDTSKLVSSGKNAVFPAGDLEVTFD